MIRWFKRKKKKDRGQESEDLFETGTEDGGTEDGGAEEGGTEEEKRDGPEEASGAQTLEEPEPVTFAPAGGQSQDNSLSGEQLPGEEDVLEEEEDVLDEEEGAPEEGVPRRGFSGVFASGSKERGRNSSTG